MNPRTRDRARAEIQVRGIVQGVGFRPFVYAHAAELQLTGYVKNLGAHVDIEVEGPHAAITQFIALLKQGPPIARIDDVSVRWGRPRGTYAAFTIAPSGQGEFGFTSPDIAICDDCLRDLRANSRYEDYWATSCVNCGPRFTVTENLPYDRETTSMVDFPMCAECEQEYHDAKNRRHHAQTIACERCGPALVLLNRDLQRLHDPIRTAGRLLLEGHILAIKGIGGFHLACIFDSAHELKRRLGRQTQPLATMAPNETWVTDHLLATADEHALLTSNKRPIMVLDKRVEGAFTEVSNLHNVGVMLPYSGLHYLLFDIVDQPLILTSANTPGEPMIIEVDDALANLREKADFFLLHDRRIVNRCDDSVVRVLDKPAFIRMSRGYAPISLAVPVSYDENILALGAEMNATVTTYKDGRCYISQHVGNIDKPKTFDYLEASVHNLIEMSGVNVSIIAHDYHPTLRSTRLAAELGPAYAVQHHEAHIASLIGEGAPADLVGIALDGIGYGFDGTIWGGEIFSPALRRVGGLIPVPMPGGDLATRHPVRMVAGILYDICEAKELIATLISLGLSNLESGVLLQQIERKVNVPMTSSTGRVLDAIAAILGICQKRTYDGEPAMRLEGVAHYGHPDVVLPLDVSTYGGRPVLDSRPLVAEVIRAKNQGKSIKNIAASAQVTIGRGIATLAADAAESFGTTNVGLSGGVAYNKAIVATISEVCSSRDLALFTNTKVPRGDAGISFGQAILTAMVKSGNYELALSAT